MTKRRPSLVFESDKGRVTIRLWGDTYRIKATMFDGDAAAEVLLAAHAMSLMQEVVRSVSHDPDLKLRLVSLRHVDDHEASA